MATNWWGRQNATPIKFDPKPSQAVFSAVLITSINADRKQLATSSGRFVGSIVPDNTVKFGDPHLNHRQAYIFCA